MDRPNPMFPYDYSVALRDCTTSPINRFAALVTTGEREVLINLDDEIKVFAAEAVLVVTAPQSCPMSCWW